MMEKRTVRRHGLSQRGRRLLRKLWPRKLRFGDLGGIHPISTEFGFDRGTPIDRYYIERFLADNAAAVCGRVLEVGDDSYTRRFGGTRVTQRDILHVRPEPGVTIVGDLSAANVLPSGAFDCAIITQTLHLIYDMAAALRQLHSSLRPGGVLLLTVPGISQIAQDEWGETWFWSLTPLSLRRLTESVFGTGNVTIGCHGNVFAATVFLQGIALEEVDASKLRPMDPSYPVTITAAARRMPD
jgi:SAM-dependent methyltransferase